MDNNHIVGARCNVPLQCNTPKQCNENEKCDVSRQCNTPMHDTPQRHHRRSIRLRGYDYSRAGAYFVTVCTHNRECLFGEIVDREMVLNDAGKIVADEWMKIAKIRNEIELDQWIVMPNHIHGILVINDPVGAIHESPLQMTVTQRRNMALPKLIGRFKMLSSKGINEMRGTPGRPVWQRNYYEHVIRNDDEMNRAREYIINNPAKWALDRENPVGACCNVPLQPHPTQPQAPEWETA